MLDDFRIVSKNNRLHSAHICLFKALLMVGGDVLYIEIVSFKVEAPKARNRTKSADALPKMQHEVKIGRNRVVFVTSLIGLSKGKKVLMYFIYIANSDCMSVK